jgi:SAM-dependent methyltransferase
LISPVTLDNPTAYFERLAAFEANHWWSAALWRVAGHWLDATLRGRSGLDAIDIGCGAGLTLRRLAERPEVAHVVGVDPCREALAYASRWGHRVEEGSALSLPFEADTFDVSTCLDVVQHLPLGGIAQAAREMARVLRVGGVAVIRSNCGGNGGLQLVELIGTFANAGFNICHASRVNAVGSLAQEVRGRLRPSRHRAHPSGGGLPTTGQGGLAHPLMAAVGWLEAYAVGRLRWRLPFGHSAMLLAIRED